MAGTTSRRVPLTSPEPTDGTDTQEWLCRGQMAAPCYSILPSLALLTDHSYSPGYSLVTHIPAGARDIQIVERKKSADMLGK